MHLGLQVEPIIVIPDTPMVILLSHPDALVELFNFIMQAGIVRAFILIFSVLGEDSSSYDSK